MQTDVDMMTSLIARASSPVIARNAAYGPYNYVPTHWVTILFVTLFALSTVLHIGQAAWFRIWWLFPTAVFCSIVEVLGWGARLYSSGASHAMIPFEIQISSTIIAPTPLLAANFVILEYIIRTLGPRYSRLSPKMYCIIFCSSDVVALIIQAVGGAMAALASGSGKNPTTGGHIMLAGIVVQMVTITFFVIFGTEFLLRYNYDKPIRRPSQTELDQADDYSGKCMDRRTRISLYAMAFSTTCLFIRAVYRTIELSNGWNGRIISTELYFNVLDGGMVILAIATLNIFHPGFLILPSLRNLAPHTYGKA